MSRVATILVDTLLDEVHRLVSGDGSRDDAATRLDHQQNGVGKFHHSRFGDALAAVLVDAAGNSLPRAIGGAWGDAFWAMIRRMEAAGQPQTSSSQVRAQDQVGSERLMALA